MNDRNKKSSALFTPSGCLSGDALMLFVSGSLKSAEFAKARKHIAECPLCSDAVEGLRMWLKENESHIISTSNEKVIPDKELSVGQSFEKEYSEKSSFKPHKEFHARTDLINERIKQRLHTHSLIEDYEKKGISYKPFVWLAAAATIVLFIGGFYLIWVQNQLDSQMIASKTAREKEVAAHIEDSLLKSTTDTLNIYILAFNGKRKPTQKQISGSAQNSSIASDKEVSDIDGVNISDYSLAQKTETIIPDTFEMSKGNSPTELPETQITAYKIPMEKKSLGNAVKGESAAREVSGVAIQKSKRSAKTESESEKPIFTIVEYMPSFPGGEEARNKFLTENIVYPVQAAENGIEGLVYISFVVNTDGKLSDFKVLGGIGGGCDEEALRVVKLMPRWKPGRQDGKAVRTLFNMPFIFKLK